MRFIIYGAGGVGGVIGARLFQQGHSVVLIARGPHLEAIQKDGLGFETPEESARLRIPAVGHPSQLSFEPEDVVLLTVKSQHTQSALDALAASAGEEVPLVCTQNGVASERMALRRFNHVYGMLVVLPASHVQPGVVQAQSRASTGLLDAGCYPGGVDARIERVTEALSGSRFVARADPSIMRLKYAKLLSNLGNAIQACCPTSEDNRELFLQARDEALACFAAAGIDHASPGELAARRGDHIQPAPVNGQRRGGGSTWQSLARAQGSVEVDYLNGEIVLLGRLHGIPTPVNRALQLATHNLCRDRGAPGSLSHTELYALIEAQKPAVDRRATSG